MPVPRRHVGGLESCRFCGYAHHHGCPWAEDTSVSAVEVGSVEMLRYAKEHECP
jgi:hypothetical protein